ncbi:alpha/beta hydrolase family protein [Parvularcula marina]|uniref:alpha/beta hydrolase family protein n=1 Tax=Parvularcula marina TaxID=2292771 RepID=UPI00351523E2
MKHRLAALAAMLALPTTALAQNYTPPPLEAFGSMPLFSNVRISPGGGRVFALARPADAKDYRFVVFENTPQGLSPIFSVEQSDEVRFRRPFWKRDDKIIFSIASSGKRYGTETVETRLFSLTPKSGKSTPLFTLNTRSARLDQQTDVPIQIQDDFVSILPNDPKNVLLEYYDEGLNSVYRVYIDDDRSHTRMLRGKEGIDDWSADGLGNIRSGRGVLYNKSIKLIVRMPDDSWKDISYRVEEGAPSFYFLGFPHDRTTAYVASSHETETEALYLYDIPSDSFVERIFHTPTSDVYNIIQQRSDGEVLGVTFAEDDGEVHWLGESFVRDVIEKVKGALPGMDVTLVNLNLTDTASTFFIEQGNIPGQYILFDHTANRLTALPSQYQALEGVPMGQTFSTMYTARDGLEIPAYVTLPPWLSSLEEAQGLPFIVLPHGGPNARTFTGFDWEVQYLVSRGYGVLEMNFRGSSGFGQEFQRAGDRQWGQAMQDDITDGAKWLIDQGYTSASNIAIMGHSYGGYAALMGAVKTPELYQCAVAHAPVTDLPRLIRYESQFIGGKYWTRRIGRLWGDRNMLQEISPALRAEDFGIPVLILHGDNDRVVNIEQSETMAARLKRANKDHKYVVLPNGSHYLDVGDNRMTFLREADAFLKDCLGH